jgi:hypothetical protein
LIALIVVVTSAHFIFKDSPNFIFTTVWLVKLILKWLFYLVLFKMKIIATVIETGAEIEEGSYSLMRRSSYTSSVNIKIQKLTKKLLILYMTMLILGIALIALRYVYSIYWLMKGFGF